MRILSICTKLHKAVLPDVSSVSYLTTLSYVNSIILNKLQYYSIYTTSKGGFRPWRFAKVKRPYKVDGGRGVGALTISKFELRNLRILQAASFTTAFLAASMKSGYMVQ